MANEARPSRRLSALVWILLVLGGLAPVVLHYFFIGDVPTLEVAEAQKLLMDDVESALVDVRERDAYEHEHLVSAHSLPAAELDALTDANQLPEALRGRKLVLICDSGALSAQATRHLRALDVEAYNSRGGLQEWFANTQGDTAALGLRTLARPGELVPTPYKEISTFQQYLAVGSSFVAKSLYMLLSFFLVVVLWRVGPVARDVLALRRGLLAFFVGESCCLINYALFAEQSYFVEYLHCYGMVVAFGFVTYASIEMFDLRIMNLSASKTACSAIRMCGPCVKNKEVPCGARRMFQAVILGVMVLFLIPLSAPLSYQADVTTVFGELHSYVALVVYQRFETLYLPIVGLALCAVAFLWMAFKRPNPMPVATILFSAAAGGLGFGMFRLLLVAAFRDAMAWNIIWEELTELLFVLGAAWVLWTFSRSWRLKRAKSAAASQRANEA